MRRYQILAFCAGMLLSLAGAAMADEAGAAQAYLAAKKAGSTQLVAFFTRFPKGADLHNHLTGAVFAESYIQWAKNDAMCIHPVSFAFSAGPCNSTTPAVAKYAQSDDGYENIVNALSMRNGPWGGLRGHDHFFAAFGKFGAVAGNHFPESVGRLLQRAKAENVQHLELMATPDLDASKILAGTLKWSDDFPAMKRDLKRAGLMKDVRKSAAYLDREMRKLGCRPNEVTKKCPVSVGFLFQITRSSALTNVFTKAVFGAELAKLSPWVYGINIVAPEDGQAALEDYTTHMKIIAWADKNVHRALHAGELTVALVPPEDLRNHVRQAVEIAGAERIGHGSDIANEDDAPQLMKEMAQKGIALELALTSNQQILGLDAGTSPFRLYRSAGVPIVLATDDPGIERTTLSRQYAKAAGWFDLSYADFKVFSENSLRYSFLPGYDLFTDHNGITVRHICAADVSRGRAGRACRRFLNHSAKALAEWKLLDDFARFEKGFPAPGH